MGSVPSRREEVITVPPEFRDLFSRATGIQSGPFEYQHRLATDPELPQLLDVPTGCGKTAAVVLAWLWRRRFAGPSTRDSTPRRLVYCLPMRVLVEQTRDECKKWLENLGLLAERPGDDTLAGGWGRDHREPGDHRIAVTGLMGGEDADEWDRYPERDAIIIGTQDMLLSRALNRGYGMSRYRWPVHYALLNNDCLWVMDEVQLMGNGLATTSQLQAFRKIYNKSGNNLSIWMSATLDRTRLNTIDNDTTPDEWAYETLSENDLSHAVLRRRRNARKPIGKAPPILTTENCSSKDCGTYAQEVVGFVLDRHIPGTLTTVIVNNVQRAQEIYKQILDFGSDGAPPRTPENTTLLHSRFRAPDRAERMRLLEGDGDRMIISTQVVEAGVDISARTLITECAPWPSLVQRFGRCNRKGEIDAENQPDPLIHWIDIDADPDNKDSANLVLPYDLSDIGTARDRLNRMSDVGLSSLQNIQCEPATILHPVIRKKDLIELFDTTPDLTGNDLDVSRYVRETDDSDVQVYWRVIPEDVPGADFEKPRREELCRVPIGRIRDFLRKNKGWMWDHLDSNWIRARSDSCKPGQIILLDSRIGGYSPLLGWIGDSGKRAEPVPPIPPAEDVSNRFRVKQYVESMNSEEAQYAEGWITVQEHCMAVSRETNNMAQLLSIPSNLCDALVLAGLWHDVGKAHEAFQNMILHGREDDKKMRENGPWGKSDRFDPTAKYLIPTESGDSGTSEERKYFRHELASALAWLQSSGRTRHDGDLIAYLIASHHGKVRQSIRSLPGETEPSEEDRLFARGVWDGDRLPVVPGILNETVRLDLSPMNMGEGSWLERTLRLRDEYGPFQLALLETVLRVSDWKISAGEQRVVNE